MSSQKLVVFDLDGTLIKSNIDYEGIRIELRNMLQNFVSGAEFEQITSNHRSILELVEFIERNDKKGTFLKDAWKFIEDKEKEGYEGAIVESDVYHTLAKLQELNHIVTILTNNSRKLTDYGLDKYELGGYFDSILTRDDVKNTKPDPEGLNTIMKLYEKNQQETIFIGDSWLDAETAINAGIDFFYIGDEGAPGTRKKKIASTGVIKKISDILSFI